MRTSLLTLAASAIAGGIALALAAGTPAAPTGKSARGLFLTRQAPKTLPAKTELAAFAAGCFWGVEQEFRKMPGVIATAVGYEGGHTKNPTYKQVCEGDTGHAETTEVEFDPAQVSYEKLLETFWLIHDPTTLNRQGPDVGDQYRSVIFTFSPAQEKLARSTRDKLQSSGELEGEKIVTEIVPHAEFTFAEDYHQQYVEKGGFAQCHFRRNKAH